LNRLRARSIVGVKKPSIIMNAYAKILFGAFLLASQGAFAQTAQTRQDPAQLRETVEHFLRTQSAGLPGQVAIKVGQVDPRLNLASCAALEPFLPNGSRVWGKATVGVRCSVPAPWTVYISATVQVTGSYVATAAPLAQGRMIGPNDVTSIRGDLTALPPGIVTDPSQAVGRTLTASLPAGTPLRLDALRSQQAVQQGQVVRLVSGGPGFRVSTEARALANGAEGQMIQARTVSGQVVSGVAKAGGVLEVAY
jgi:flagella basal body P-ring formation protein FlgA